MSTCKHCGDTVTDPSGRCGRCGYLNESVGTAPVVSMAEEVGNTSLDTTPPRIARYPRHASATGGAIAAVTLGALGLVVAIFSKLPIIGLLLAALGVLLGAWGLLGQRRGLATVGLLLCLLAILVGGTREVIRAYRSIYKGQPIAPSVEEVAP